MTFAPGISAPGRDDEARLTAPDAVLSWWVEPCDTDGDGEEIPGTDWRGPVALAQYLGEQIVYGHRRS